MIFPLRFIIDHVFGDLSHSECPYAEQSHSKPSDSFPHCTDCSSAHCRSRISDHCMPIVSLPCFLVTQNFIRQFDSFPFFPCVIEIVAVSRMFMVRNKIGLEVEVAQKTHHFPGRISRCRRPSGWYRLDRVM